MTASIVGWAHTPFGKFDAETVESLVVKVATEAMANAGISAEDVDEIVLGHFNAGLACNDRVLRQCCIEIVDRITVASRVAIRPSATSTGCRARHRSASCLALRKFLCAAHAVVTGTNSSYSSS